MTARARTHAYSALLDVLVRGKYSNVALKNIFRASEMDERDKGLCTEIVYGTLQAMRTLDAVIEPLVHRGLDVIDKRVLVLLRMSVYQLAFLDRVPKYAVLDDAVELCKRATPKAAGFVNGVLRAYTRDKRTFAERIAVFAANLDDVDRLGLMYSYPSWLCQRLLNQFGEERTEKVLQAFNQRSELSIRVNSTRITRDALWKSLSEDERTYCNPSRVSPLGIRFSKGMDVERWSLYQDGLVSVQDEASMLIAPLLQPSIHTNVMDMCAGMGTKTTQVLEMLSGEGKVDAVDIHQHKLQALKAAAVRLGLDGVKTHIADARSLHGRQNMREYYDAVLLDAPCSGTGVLRRRPEIRWRRTAEDVVSLGILQRELLQTALQLVKLNGVVVYATCSLLSEENEHVVQEVLKEQPGQFILDDLQNDLPPDVWSECSSISTSTTGFYITPEQFSTDGFYMARIRRVK